MASFKRFEDIEAWQLARKLSDLVYKYITKDNFSKDYKLKEQVNGSSGSVMDNIAEGFGRGGNKEFIQFLRIAKGSCTESKSQLYRAIDRNYITDIEFKNAESLIEETNTKIQSLINYLKNSDYKGPNYK